MAIISKNKRKRPLYFPSAQLRYAAAYILITFAILFFLNVLCSQIGQEVFRNSKETSMTNKCKLAASHIADLEALNANTVGSAVAGFEDLNLSRLIITDQNSDIIYDSYTKVPVANQYFLYPEIVAALQGNQVFYWNFRNGVIRSTAACPVYASDTLIGCVYMLEYDVAQGTLFAALQQNILSITLVLEIIVVLYSIIFSISYSKRLRRIMSTIRTVRTGDYTNKVTMSGHDELNALGDEFNDLITRLQTSEQKRNRFVSDASHELKTPLASIKLLTDSILQNEMDTETTREFVSDIGNEAERLNRMSQKLLTLSRIDDQTEASTQITHIIPTLQRVIRMLKGTAEKSEVAIIEDIQADCGILIHEDDLYQVIFNLAENGIKYTGPGGSLTVSVRYQEGNAVIIISDTGIGIPEDSLEHIFERFYRVDKARSRATGGSGLGLSIVRNIVERNNGQISVSSIFGKGTEFTITFPAYPAIQEDLL